MRKQILCSWVSCYFHMALGYWLAGLGTGAYLLRVISVLLLSCVLIIDVFTWHKSILALQAMHPFCFTFSLV